MNSPSRAGRSGTLRDHPASAWDCSREPPLHLVNSSVNVPIHPKETKVQRS